MTRTSQWIHGWLLLLPAFVLLALFTHYPAVATVWHSFFSTPKGSRPVVFVGVDNYRQRMPFNLTLSDAARLAERRGNCRRAFPLIPARVPEPGAGLGRRKCAPFYANLAAGTVYMSLTF